MCEEEWKKWEKFVNSFLFGLILSSNELGKEDVSFLE